MKAFYTPLFLALLFILGPGLPRAWAAPPANDDCASAEELTISDGGFGTGTFVSSEVDLTDATKKFDEPFHPVQLSAGTDKKTAWFKFHLPTARGVKVALTQPGEGIAEDGAGFTVFKSGNCFPSLDAVQPAKLTPLNKFGSSFNPCLDAGDYLVQVSGRQDADSVINLELTVSMPGVLSAYDQPADAYQFGTLNPSWRSVEYDIGCQTIDSAGETCSALGSNYEDYTQTSWHTFSTDGHVDMVRMELFEEIFTGNLKVGYNLYQGDARTTTPSALSLIRGCQVIEQTSENQRPGANWPCLLQPNTTYSIQIFFHQDYSNTFNLRLYETGGTATQGEDPANLPASNRMGTLPSGPSGIWTGVSDWLSCESFIDQNACGTANPASGEVNTSGNSYNLATWYTFVLDEAANIRLDISRRVRARVFAGDITSDCDLSPMFDFKNRREEDCFPAGTYSIQVLGHTDTTASNIENANASQLGRPANLNVRVETVTQYNDFALNNGDAVDSINGMNDLPNGAKIFSDGDEFGCLNTVLPDNNSCGDQKAIYRILHIGDSDGDGSDDDGILRVGGGNWRLRYELFEGDAQQLAISQNVDQAGETISGLNSISGCERFYWTHEYCVTPGTYTLVTYGEDRDVGRGDQPWVEFEKEIATTFDDPVAPDNLGDITSALEGGNVRGTRDYFFCENNAITIQEQAPCGPKAIYRQFYIDKPMYFNISSGHNFRLFKGAITSGLDSLETDIGGSYGYISQCRSNFSANTDACNPEKMPAGWYTVVSYGNGGIYNGPSYQAGDAGEGNNITLSLSSPPTLAAPQYNRPGKAYDAGTLTWNAGGGSSAYPETDRTYTLGTENFNCQDDLPFSAHPVSACSGYNRTAYYRFELSEPSFLSLENIPSDLAVEIYKLSAFSDTNNLDALSPLQPCIRRTNIRPYDRAFNTWQGRIEICEAAAGPYVMVVYADDGDIGQSVTPRLYLDQIRSSRFDHAQNLYDFDSIPGDSSRYLGRLGDTNPLDPDRAPSNDFFTCRTGAQPSDPGQDESRSLCFDGLYQQGSSNPTVPYPQPAENLHYQGLSTTNKPIRRNLWYSFTVKGPGKVSVSVFNKTPGKTSQYPFTIYRSDDSTLATIDSTKSDGLTFVDNNSTFDFWGCDGNKETVSFNISPCDPNITRRYYVLVDDRENLQPNHQVEVGVRFDSVPFIPVKYDFYSHANVINGLGETSPPYTSVDLDSGRYDGAQGSFPCATKSPASDQNDCGETTLWYKFQTQVSGKVRLNYTVTPGGTFYQGDNIQLYKETIPGDSTPTSLKRVSLSSRFLDGENWGEGCLSPGTYYILLTGCSYELETVVPHLWIDENPGDQCTNPVAFTMNSVGTESASVTVDCHTIGEGFGEDGSNMSCLFGPEDYKSTWFRVKLGMTDKVDLSFRLSESTNALPSQIRYRVLFGTCGAMTSGPCNTDALTEFTLNCMESQDNNYFVQVVTPEWAQGDISLEVNTSLTSNQNCEPLDPLKPVANFFVNAACSGTPIQFNNTSSQGDSITYDWDFGVSSMTSDTSDSLNPSFTYPVEPNPEDYDVELIVTNTATGAADTITQTLTVYPQPGGNITIDSPHDTSNVLPAGTDIQYRSNPSTTISSPATTYTWDLAGGLTSTAQDPVANYSLDSISGTGIVTLQIANGNCVNTHFDTITVGFEPVFVGGHHDGATMQLDTGNCPVRNVFIGGNYDGADFRLDEGNCPTGNVFVGGNFDGAEMSLEQGQCPQGNVFVGGNYDGADFTLDEGNCPSGNVFVGGNYDGSEMALESADCPNGNIFIGGNFDGADWGLSGASISAGGQDTLCPSASAAVELVATGTPQGIDTDSTTFWNTGPGTPTLATDSTLMVGVDSTDPGFDTSITATTSFMVSFVPKGGCERVSQDFEVVLLTPTNANAGPDRTICPPNTTVQLGASGPELGVEYRWSPSTGLDDSTKAQPMASPSSTTTYALSTFEPGGDSCAATDSVTVTVEPKPTINISNDTTICPTDNVTLHVGGGDQIDLFQGDTANMPLTSTALGVDTLDYTTSDSALYIARVFDQSCSEFYLDSVRVSKESSGQPLHFRTTSAGDWTDPANWEVSTDQSSWTASPAFGTCGGAGFPDSRDLTVAVRHNTTFNSALAFGIDQTTIEGSGDLLVPAGVTLKVVDSSGSLFPRDLHNKGRLEIAGTFQAVGSARLDNEDSSWVEYSNGNQPIHNTAYGNLRVSGGGLKTLTGPQTRIQTSLDFAGAHVQLDNFDLRITPDAQITNASTANGYVVTGQSGSLLKENLDSTAFQFPVGISASDANFLTLANNGTPDDISARVEAGFAFHDNFDDDELQDSSSLNRTWQLEENTVGGSDLIATTEWKTADENPFFQRNFAALGSYSSVDGWQRRGPISPLSGSGSAADPYALTASGITSVNALSVGSCNSEPLRFRTIDDGVWTDVSIWEVYDPARSEWVEPFLVQSSCGDVSFPTSFDSTIAVRHQVTYDSTIAEGIDEVTLQANADLWVPDTITLRMMDGPGNDIRNQGYLDISGTFWAATDAWMENEFGSIVRYSGDMQALWPGPYASLWIDGTGFQASSHKSITAGDTVTVRDSLRFFNGKIDLGSGFARLMDTTIVEGAGQNSGYLIATGNGALIRGFSSGTDVAGRFPIGGQYFSPADLEFNNVTTAGTMSARVKEKVHPKEPDAIARFWTLTQGSLDFSGVYTAELTYSEEDLPVEPSSISEELSMVARAGVHSPIYNTPNNFLYSPDSTDYTADVTTNTGQIIHNRFSDFTFLPETQTPLPIHLLTFEGFWHQDNAQLEWVTVHEKDAKGFELQRSLDGQHFQTIAYLPAKGSPQQLADYHYLDTEVGQMPQNVFHYRLKQIDQNGEADFSQVVTLDRRETAPEEEELLSIYPNPVRSGESLNLVYRSEGKQRMNIALYTLAGQELLRERPTLSQGINNLDIPIGNLPNAMYLIRISTRNEQFTEKIIVE